MSLELAERISDRVLRVPGVVRLSGGALGGASTFGSGRRVNGVRIRQDHIEVHVVAAGSVPSIPAVAAVVRRAVSDVDPTRAVDVFVDDVDLDVVDLDAVALDAVIMSAEASR